MATLKTIIYSIALALILICGTSLYAQISISREYQIKAVFLLNFTQFIEWPEDAFATTDSPLVIGVLGENPFGTQLKETIAGEKINGHPLAVEYYKKVEDINSCHILFVSSSQMPKFEEVVSNLTGKNVLIVDDANNYMHQGSMIKFFNQSNKIQFQINPDAIKNTQLTVSSKLLRVAKVVKPKKN
ncbi:YfiR family protein [Reichenbachiella sp. MALMAid0571]|uniref:YfiR family protein n=1 Tax=Reichenbachiella sp. MALMAid0571 TaxID=3143939 RepID=UPI0032DFB2BE